ncbi:helix-turn-helix domain-containing protein [Lyngbya aestuarii]|uniref:helix-turn-helix domain-containing protein n=1 Tax=Lyngbya aestuarii TaxID=118322 RepID=UPI00403D942D
MSISKTRQLSDNNLILATLPREEYQRLAPYLETVYLSLGQVLYERREVIEYIYFPTHSMVSLVALLRDELITEFALVGNEGIVGIPVLLGSNITNSRAIVQLAGTAQKIDANILKTEFQRGQNLQKLSLLYTQALLNQVAQNAVCKSHHNVENRLARWLLSVQDCVKTDELQLTQKYISYLLGTRRATITEAAISLQDKGAISYSRGKIIILDREILAVNACECYEVVREEYHRLFGVKKD